MKYGCTPSRLAFSPGEGERGVLEQENSPDLSVGVAGNPEALHVAADEECRNCHIHDGGIEGLKLCSYCGVVIGRRQLGAFAFSLDCWARWPSQSSL
jgi:hypothetical protein